MTCFIEYPSPDTVIVHDLIYVRDASGRWALEKSSYEKLCLPVEWVRRELQAAGFRLTKQETGRMVMLSSMRDGY